MDEHFFLLARVVSLLLSSLQEVYLLGQSAGHWTDVHCVHLSPLDVLENQIRRRSPSVGRLSSLHRVRGPLRDFVCGALSAYLSSRSLCPGSSASSYSSCGKRDREVDR